MDFWIPESARKKAGCTPDSNHESGTEEPVSPDRTEMPCLALWRHSPFVLDDCEAVAEYHCGAEGQSHLLDKQVEVEELSHQKETSGPLA